MGDDTIGALQEIKQIHSLPVMTAVENREWHGVDLSFYVKNPTSQALEFEIELLDGGPLPSGLSCSKNGVMQGIPKAGTARQEPYIFLITVLNDLTWPLVLEGTLFVVTVAEAEKLESEEYLPESEPAREEQNFWKQFAEGQLPSIENILTRDVTTEDIGWLLERMATVTIWNTDDSDLPEQGKLIEIPNVSERYAIYDFNSILVATPKDLYDPNRCFADYVQTAIGLAQEVQKRGWKIIELAGFDKMKTAVWVEIQKWNVDQVEEEQINIRSEESPHDVEVFMNQMSQEEKLKDMNLSAGIRGE